MIHYHQFIFDIVIIIKRNIREISYIDIEKIYNRATKYLRKEKLIELEK